MKIISILKQKSGYGKTTISTNLAVAMSKEHNVLLADAHPQQASASDWHNVGGYHFVDSVSTDKTSMMKGLKNVGEAYDFVIVDTSPTKNQLAAACIAIHELAAACIAISDLVLIPVQPSPYDVWAYADLVSVIKQRQQIRDGHHPTAKFIINAAKPGTNSFSDIKIEIEEYGIQKLKTVLYRREAYSKTASLGNAVVTSSDAKAKSEFEGCVSTNFESRNMKIKREISDTPKAMSELKTKERSRLTIDIDAQVHAKLKAKCALEKRRMNEVIETLVSVWL